MDSQLHGYSGKVLRVNLSSGRIWTTPTEDYVEFVGGRGMALKAHWDEVSPEVGPFHPDNRLTFSTGPLTGFAGFASSRWQVSGKSPVTEPETFCYANLGGSWGVALKYLGYDSVVVQGKADKPVYLLITEDHAELRDAAHLWGKGAIDTRMALRSDLGDRIDVVACGQAGENLAVAAGVVAEMDSTGAGGMGAVMGSKKLKAIALARGARYPVAADPDQLKALVMRYRRLIGDKAPLDGVLDQYLFIDPTRTEKQYCRGCPGPCIRIAWEADEGMKGKFFCQAALLYQGRAKKFYGKETDVGLRVTKLCDNYGLDTRAMHVTMAWLARCFRAGILTEEQTGVPLSKEGSLEYAETLLRKIATREGFGDVLAQGLKKAAREVGKGALEMTGDLLHKAEQDELYGGRTYIVNGLLWAMDPRQPIGPIHETAMLAEHWVNWVRGRAGAYISDKVIHDVSVRFFGSEAAADFSSYEGKALAAKMIQDREYAKECLILCDMAWPIKTSLHTEDRVGDPSLESQFLSAVTGQEIDEQGLYAIGEKVFNLQRAIMAREGHAGRQGDSLPEYNFSTPLKSQFMNPEMLVPGPGGKPASRKGAVIDRDKFEQMKGEYYQLRGWDVATGRQTRASLERVGLKYVADDLEKRGLLADARQSERRP